MPSSQLALCVINTYFYCQPIHLRDSMLNQGVGNFRTLLVSFFSTVFICTFCFTLQLQYLTTFIILQLIDWLLFNSCLKRFLKEKLVKKAEETPYLGKKKIPWAPTVN